MRDTLRTLLKRVDPGDWAAFLVGSGGGFLALGLLEHFFRLFDPTPTTWRMVLGADFLALAAGLLIPHRLATWLAARMWRRLRGPAAGAATLPYSAFLPAQKDRPLHRVVLAGVALCCGGAAIISLGLFRLARQAHDFLLNEFLWGSAGGGLLVAVECGLVVVVVGFVFVPVGLTWGCVHHLSCPVGGWRVRPLAGVSAGLAVAGFAASAGAGRSFGLHPDLLLLVGSVPFFLLSILSTRFSTLQGQPSAEACGAADRTAPQARDRWPVLIRAAVIATFACAVLSAGIWWRVFGILATPTVHGGAVALTMWGLGVAVGVALECAVPDRRMHSIGALGLSCALAGVGTALSAACLGLLGVWGHRVAGHAAGTYFLAALIVGLPAFAMGHAVSYGYHAALARVGHRSEIGAALLFRMMLAAAAVVIFLLTPLVPAFGTYAGQVAVSLVLVGVGGALIIHEPTYLRNTRRLRLGMVFGSIVLMSLGLPHAQAEWLATRPWKRLRLEENAWLTRSVWAVRGDIRSLAEPSGCNWQTDAFPFAPAPEPTHMSADWQAAPGSLRAALLGTPPQPRFHGIAAAAQRCDHRLFDPSSWPQTPQYASTRRNAVQPGRESATRFLRRTPRRYDVMVIAMGDLPSTAWAPALRFALLERALDRLRIDGVLILAVPVAQRSRLELLTSLQALRIADHPGLTWSTTAQGPEVTLWLAFGKDSQWRERWRSRLPWVNRNHAELVAVLTGSEKNAADTLPRGPNGQAHPY